MKSRAANSKIGGGILSNTQGFTLIELLAVIVILGLLAVLIIPKVAETIRNARSNINKASASGLQRVAEKYYVERKSSLNSFHGCSYDFTANTNTCDGLDFSGDKPASGILKINSDGRVAFSVKIGDDYFIKRYYSDVLGVDYDICDSTSSVFLYDNFEVLLEAEDGAKYFTSSSVDNNPIYYNPNTGMLCNDYEGGNSDIGNITGCMKWHLYSLKGDYVNMLLDHNITGIQSNAGVWASETDYTAGLTPIMHGETLTGYQSIEGTDSKATSAGITYPNTVTLFNIFNNNKNSRGPVTVLNTLKSLTSTWITDTPKVPNKSNSYEQILIANLNDNKYQIDYTGYHARLITKEEAEFLGCVTEAEYLENNISCPEWMVSDTYNAQSPYGFWTSSVWAGHEHNAWNLYYGRFLNNSQAANINYGIRPVITVSLYDVL